MQIVKEITVAMENVPGALAQLTEGLASEGINMVAISTHEAVAMSSVRMVVDKPAEAIKMLIDLPLTVKVTEALAVNLDNQPGALADVAKKLANRRINIDYLYGSVRGEKKATIIIHTASAKRAYTALKGK